MSKRNGFFVFALAVLLFAEFAALSCKRGGSTCGEVVVSVPLLSRSHNNAINCATCHAENGVGTGCFIVSGSVYLENQMEAYPNAVIRFYAGPNGTGGVKATYRTDAKGNFYSTEILDFNQPLYPAIIDASNNVVYKNRALLPGEGNCNKCHTDIPNRLHI